LSELLGAAQHFGNADPRSGEAMTDLLGIGPDPEQSQRSVANPRPEMVGAKGLGHAARQAAQPLANVRDASRCRLK
jgi:hypothetical protein